MHFLSSEYLITGNFRERIICENYAPFVYRKSCGLISERTYFKSYIVINFPNFTITPTVTEQEIGYVSPFYKWNAIYTWTQRKFYKLKTNSRNKVTETRENIYITLAKNRV